MKIYIEIEYGIKYLTRQGKYKVIDSLRQYVSVSYLCKRTEISERSYYKWVQNGKKDGVNLNQELADYITSLEFRKLNHLGYRSIKYRYQDETNNIVSLNQIKRVSKIVGYQSKQKKKIKYNLNKNINNNNRKNLFKEDFILKYLKNKGLRLRKSLISKNSNDIWSADITTIFSKSNNLNQLNLISIMDNHDRSIIFYKFTNGLNQSQIFRGMIISAIKKHGIPKILHMDNGGEFINNGIKAISEKYCFKLSYSDPGKPNQNGLIENLHKSLKIEINLNKFESREKAIKIISEWIYFYNNKRRHSKLLYKSDLKFISPVGNKVFSKQTPSKAREISLYKK